MKSKSFIAFSINNIDFAILKSKVISIEKNLKLNKDKIFDLHSLFDSSYNKNKYFSISSSLVDKHFVISKSLKIINVNDQHIKFFSKIHPYISGLLFHKNKLFFIISLPNIVANNYEIKKFDLDYLNKIISSKKIISKFEKSQLKQVKSKVKESQTSISNKEQQTTDTVDEERKNEIYDEIEKIIDNIKIKDYDKRAKESLKKVKSFFSKIILLYAGLILTTSAAFALIYSNSLKERNKIITEVTSSGTLESIIIKELQRKQEQEKQALENQLKNVQSQLNQIKAEKEEFLKNQDKILKEKEKKLYEEYQKKLEREKALLAQQGISEEEYNQRINQINQEYNLEKQKVSAEIQKVKDEYLKKLNEKEVELKSQALSFQKELTEKSQEISKIQKEKESLEAQIAKQQQKQAELAKEIQKMQTLADEKIRVVKFINEYYEKIYEHLKNKKYNDAKLKLEKLIDFLENSKEIVVLTKEELLNNKLISNQLMQTIDFYINSSKDTVSKNLLFQKANDLLKRRDFNKAYQNYIEAFTKYSVLTGKENSALTNFSKIDFLEIEKSSSQVINSIDPLLQNNNYEEALIQIQQFLSDKNDLFNFQKVISIEDELINKIKILNIDKIVEKQYNEAYEIFKLGQLQNSKEKLFDILKTYPESSYTTKIIDLLTKIDSQLKNAKPLETKKEVTEETIKTVGRVLQTFGNYILFSTSENIDLKIDDILKIYSLSNNIYKYIGSIRIIEFSNGFGKGVIVYKEEEIKIGDFLSQE